MADATLFDPQIGNAQLASKAFGPKQIRCAFVQADNVGVRNVRQHQFFFSPHSRAEWPHGAFIARIPQLHPRCWRTSLERIQVMRNFQKPTSGTAIDDFVQFPAANAGVGVTKPSVVFHNLLVILWGCCLGIERWACLTDSLRFVACLTLQISKRDTRRARKRLWDWQIAR